MKRRQAVQNIASVSAGIVFLSSCDFLEKEPVYLNLPLESNQRPLISQLSDAILPKASLELETPETTLDFVLTMLNDCYSPMQIEKFIAGLDEFQLYLEENYKRRFDKLEPGLKSEILQYLEASEGQSEELIYFFTTTKRLTIQHFTSSDFFMTSYLDYEMVPGRFYGCVSL